MTKVQVSLVNFNHQEDTLLCLDSLEQIQIRDFELNVVIVDNASKEIFGTDKSFKNFNLKIIRSEKNLGFAGGQNLAIKNGLENGIDYFVILNNDVILDKNFLVELLETFKSDDKCGIVSPKIYFAKGHEFHKDRYSSSELGKVIWYAGGKTDWGNLIASHRGVDEVDNGQYQETQETDYASGCCEVVKRAVLEKTGLFDEKYFLYYEDNDLSQRARANGFKIYYQPKSMLWHLNAGSTGGSGSNLHDYYITRNRMLFGFKYASFKTKFALVRESLRILLNGRVWQKKGITDFYLGKFGKGSFNA